MHSWIDLRVARKWSVAADVVAFELVADPAATPELPPFEAGAYVDVQIQDGQDGLLRSYSLCNAPAETHRYVIAVKRERLSRGASNWLHDKVQAGDTLRVRHPRNEFPLNRSAVYSALFAGGIGITPLLGMAEDLWRRGAGFELHYSARNARHAAFANDLVHAPYRHQVHVHWSENQPGRIDFGRCLGGLPSLSHIYVCGPSPFLASALNVAGKLSWPHDRLHFERFV
jgi:vanillate O-demethylase ferredoxin subunit